MEGRVCLWVRIPYALSGLKILKRFFSKDKEEVGMKIKK